MICRRSVKMKFNMPKRIENMKDRKQTKHQKEKKKQILC